MEVALAWGILGALLGLDNCIPLLLAVTQILLQLVGLEVEEGGYKELLVLVGQV